MATANRARPGALLLILGALLLGAPLAACEDEQPLLPDAAASSSAADGGADAAPRDAGAAGGDAAEAGATSAVIECFKGTPKTHEELLNACWGETVVGVSKTVTLPGGYVAGNALPPPP
jgi:hypothetical protein